MQDKVYVYESHLGGLYTSNEPLDYEDLYCETCGDSDWELGDFNNFKEFYDVLINDDRYYDKDSKQWLLSEEALSSIVNELVAYWKYPIQELKETENDHDSYTTINNRMYEIMQYENKRFCYEVECFDGDIYYLETELIDDLLNMYPEERPLDFTYSLIEKNGIPKDCNVMTHMPVCFWDEFENWKERTQYNETH